LLFDIQIKKLQKYSGYYMMIEVTLKDTKLNKQIARL